MTRSYPLLGLVALLAVSCLPAFAQQTAQPRARASTYVLSPDDVLLLKVYREDDMETRVRVAKDGTASFPLIGTIRVGGYTIEQVSELIRRLLDKDFLVNPQVTLSVEDYAKRRFTVLGQVGKPGTYEMPGDQIQTTLLQAIAVAGGFTRLAKTSQIVITRSNNGERTRFVISAREANDPEKKAFTVFPDDTITVPERLF